MLGSGREIEIEELITAYCGSLSNSHGGEREVRRRNQIREQRGQESGNEAVKQHEDVMSCARGWQGDASGDTCMRPQRAHRNPPEKATQRPAEAAFISLTAPKRRSGKLKQAACGITEIRRERRRRACGRGRRRRGGPAMVAPEITLHPIQRPPVFFRVSTPRSSSFATKHKPHDLLRT